MPGTASEKFSMWAMVSNTFSTVALMVRDTVVRMDYSFVGGVLIEVISSVARYPSSAA